MARGAVIGLVLAAGLAVAPPVHAAAREVALVVSAPGDPRVVPPVIDRLVDGEVLRMTVNGAEGGATGTVRQCVLTAGRLDSCRNFFPVLFDGEGAARFQYQVHDPGDCGPTAACVVAVEIAESERRALGFVVFDAAAAAPPRVALTPGGPYRPGQSVTVTIAGLASGAPVTAAFCTTTSCEQGVSATADGTGQATLGVTIGGRCATCFVRVDAGPRPVLVRVGYVALPSPAHSARRLSLWLGVAALLLAAAWYVAARTDWRPPSEADTPDLDAARLND